MNLPRLLRQVLAELARSTDPERLALLQRLRGGTHTPRDASEVADLIEALLERAATREPDN
jgi:hypothetical protein